MAISKFVNSMYGPLLRLSSSNASFQNSAMHGMKDHFAIVPAKSHGVCFGTDSSLISNEN